MSYYIYTLGDIKKSVYKCLDEYSINGKVHSNLDGAGRDFENRIIDSINSNARRVYFSLVKNTLSENFIFSMPNILSSVNSFSVSSGQSQSVTIPDGSGAASFMYCGKGSVSFCDASDNVIKTYSLLSEYGCLTNFKDFIPGSVSYIKFSSSDSFTIKHLRIYDSEISSGIMDKSMIPDGRYLYCKLPDNFAGIKTFKSLNSNSVLNDIFSFDDTRLFCPEKYAGEYKIEYFAYPPAFSEFSSDNEVLYLPPIACTAVIYAVAADLCFNEDSSVYSKLIYKFQDICNNCYSSAGLEERKRNSFYSTASVKKFGR